MDGSAAPFVYLIEQAGIRAQAPHAPPARDPRARSRSARATATCASIPSREFKLSVDDRLLRIQP